jgi:hypothetical protein
VLSPILNYNLYSTIANSQLQSAVYYTHRVLLIFCHFTSPLVLTSNDGRWPSWVHKLSPTVLSGALSNNWLLVEVKSKLLYDERSVDQSVLVSGHHLGPVTNFISFSFKLYLDSCGFVTIGRPLWREGGFVIYSCCWASPAQSSLVRVPWDSWPYFIVSSLRFPQSGGLGSRIYIPWEQSSPVILRSFG